MRRLLLMLLPSAALVACLYLVELPLWLEAPGDAHPVLPRIAIDGAPTYPSDGRLLLTTVNVGRANVFESLRAWLDPDVEILLEREVLPPGQTDREYERVSLSQMDASKIAAVSVALERATRYPEDRRPGVIVHDTLAGTPASGHLFSGDLILSVDGERVEGLEAFGATIDQVEPGQTLRFRVRPLEGGEERTVSLRPVDDPNGEGRIVGISAIPNFPFDVHVESGVIGGPSAGLMWSVGVTDLLTPEDLTGGREIAGTGTVDLGGNVGPIGGITLKVAAAEEAGARTFLLPRGNLAEARTVETDVRLVPVDNVDQALSFLEAAT